MGVLILGSRFGGSDFTGLHLGVCLFCGFLFRSLEFGGLYNVSGGLEFY